MIGGDVDDVMTFVRVRFEIIETVPIPDTLVVGVTVAVSTNDESRRLSRKVRWLVETEPISGLG